MWLHKLFLIDLFRKNKILFILFSAYIGLTFYFNYKGVETTPFFIWAMYAGKESPKDRYKIVVVTYNEGNILNLPHTYQEPQSMMIYFTLNHYRKIEMNGMTDPLQNVLDSSILPHYPFLQPVAPRLVSDREDIARYLEWFKTYLQSIVGVPVSNVNVIEKTVHYNTDGQVAEDSSKILYSIP